MKAGSRMVVGRMSLSSEGQSAGMTNTGVRQADATEVARLSELLATAFQDDVGSLWLFPDANERRQFMPSFFECFVRTYLPYGSVYTTDDMVAAAIWAPPGVEQEVEDGLLASLMEAIPESHVPRMVSLLSAFEPVHPEESHYHLAFIGTDASRRSQGIGSALMRPVLELCDQDGIPAYLESGSERNRKLYLRHGFEVTADILLPDGSTAWAMWRQPRPSG
jgi:ribosomal protein S18 acetylase RimI-like enzyme